MGRRCHLVEERVHLLGAAMRRWRNKIAECVLRRASASSAPTVGVARDDHALVGYCHLNQGVVGGPFEAETDGVDGVVAGQSQELARPGERF
jgi:hypothetical protein